MKLDPSLTQATASRCRLRSLSSAALLGLPLACGSPSEQASQSGSPPAPSPASAGEGASPAAPGGSSMATVSEAPATELPPAPVLVPAPGGAAGASGGAVTRPITSVACDGATDDACGACVCDRCSPELADCLNVEGCAEILACVRASGCSGRDCYCGSASLADCLAGDAQGPCKDVVLEAPGASAPTLQSPSAGPASDASLRVADCAQARGACRDLCEESD